jgi:hypothetical protein
LNEGLTLLTATAFFGIEPKDIFIVRLGPLLGIDLSWICMGASSTGFELKEAIFSQ